MVDVRIVVIMYCFLLNFKRSCQCEESSDSSIEDGEEKVEETIDRIPNSSAESWSMVVAQLGVW